MKKLLSSGYLTVFLGLATLGFFGTAIFAEHFDLTWRGKTPRQMTYDDLKDADAFLDYIINNPEYTPETKQLARARKKYLHEAYNREHPGENIVGGGGAGQAGAKNPLGMPGCTQLKTAPQPVGPTLAPPPADPATGTEISDPEYYGLDVGIQYERGSSEKYEEKSQAGTDYGAEQVKESVEPYCPPDQKK